MRKLLCVLAITILLIKYNRSTLLAEEINSEVPNMRELTQKDPTVRFLQQEPIEAEELDDNAGDDDDSDTSPSEIVETHVPPDAANEPEELTSQMKRPRRRRRRRRRKRPKTTANPTTEELETYYTLPEEEIRRKPSKYRPVDGADEIIPENSNLPRRRNAKRRRRPLKRPTMEDYPATAEDAIIAADYTNNTAEEQPSASDHRNNDDQLLTDENSTKVKKPPKVENDETRVKIFLKEEDHFQKNPAANATNTRKTPQNHAQENEPPTKVSPQHDELNANHRRRKRPPNNHQKANNEAAAEETKYETNPTTQNLKPNGSQRHQQESNGHAARKHENKPNEINANKFENVDEDTSSNVKTKTEEHVNTKLNDTSKKEIIFKLRRLPPTSAILRHIKIKPNLNVKNETQSVITASSKNEINAKLEDSVISNEILSHSAENDTTNRSGNDHRQSTHTEQETSESVPNKTVHDQKPSYSVHEEGADNAARAGEEEESFEFPIITYTGSKQSRKLISTPSSPGNNNATENATVIYILCNHTIDDTLKNRKLNSTNDTTQAKLKYVSVIHNHSVPIITNSTIRKEIDFKPSNLTDDEKFNILKTISVEDLEKLFFEDEKISQSNLRLDNNSIASTNITSNEVNPNRTQNLAHNLDTSESETRVNYLLQNSAEKLNTSDSKFTLKDTKNSKFTTEQYFREPKWFQDVPKYKSETKEQSLATRKHPPNENPNFVKSFPGSSKELIISYTSTNNPNYMYNEIIPEETLVRDELSLHLNNSFHRKIFHENITQRNKNHLDRKKLPLAVKSAIIISGAILALAVLGFFALLLSCKIRQAKSRMKCNRELYREQFQNSEFRQSSRSTSPVVSKSNYNGRNFTNNIQSNVASNRNYYLWQTLRKTFQYD